MNKIVHIKYHWNEGCLEMRPFLRRLYFDFDGKRESHNLYTQHVPDIHKYILKSDEVLAENLCEKYYKTRVTAMIGQVLLDQRVMKIDEINKHEIKNYYDYTVFKKRKIHNASEDYWYSGVKYTWVWCDEKRIYKKVQL